MPPTLQSDFPRGAVELSSGAGPSARFESDDNIARTPSLRFAVPNSEGRVFLGVTGGEVNKLRLPDGRVERYTMAGTAIGVPDDRHIITVAGSCSGKGRGMIIPCSYWPKA